MCARGAWRRFWAGPSTSPLGVTGSAVPGSDDIQPPDGPLTPEQQAVADSLSTDLVARIDTTLLSHAKRIERKVAMIVALTMADTSLRVAGFPDVFYVQRVKALVQRGLLVAEGNLDYMCYSEVRLP